MACELTQRFESNFKQFGADIDESVVAAGIRSAGQWRLFLPQRSILRLYCPGVFAV